ncbi:MAG: VWA domain-containing protein [Bacteroidales bacterium]|nr:VWA domain-containing protein [Bacteroidales bacterium]
MTKFVHTIIIAGALASASALAFSCMKAGSAASFDSRGGAYPMDAEAAYSDGGNGQGGGDASGIVTAGEWNDLDNWKFWSKLAEGDFKDMTGDWGFYTDGRVAVKAVDEDGVPVCGAKVELLRDGSAIWTTKTDNHGRAECWTGLYDGKYASSGLSLAIAGKTMEEIPAVTWFQDDEVKTNVYTISPISTQYAADIAFIVDATGSMADEIMFLKSDMVSIIKKVMESQSGMKIRTGAVFYRDEGDDYLTRTSNFNDELSVTRDFIEAQNADGGGDYPEAVHSALEASIQELSWSSEAMTRLAFMLLDAPAHDDPAIIESLHKSIRIYAQNGIKLIPISASGIEKSTEALLRMFSIATNATYVFITNDSGVGNDHIEASVGDYQVEKLNDLIIRLINYYTETPAAEQPSSGSQEEPAQ